MNGSLTVSPPVDYPQLGYRDAGNSEQTVSKCLRIANNSLKSDANADANPHAPRRMPGHLGGAGEPILNLEETIKDLDEQVVWVWQSKGRGFESPQLHQILNTKPAQQGRFLLFKRGRC
jgi:hypothetical protein